MNQKRKEPSFLMKRGLHIFDAVLFVLFLALAFFLKSELLHLQDLFQFRSEISMGYLAKQQGDRVYVIDSGHSRFFCFDRDGNEIFEISDPSDNGESILYIDDLSVSGKDIYLSASEWDGMQIARELIVKIDQDGNYLETIAERDYSSRFMNKHRFYGLHTGESSLVYAECLENSFLIHRVELADLSERVESLAYKDAFNAVGDIVFDENEIPVVLNKDGTIERFRSATDQGLVYTTAWPGEELRVPYRLGIYDGAVYFTDIRSGAVVRADQAGQTGVVCHEGTDSQTVFFTPEGRMLLAESGGIHMTGKEDAVFLDFQKPESMIRDQQLKIAAAALLAVVFVLLLFRALVLVLTHKFTLTEGVGFSIIAAVIIVSGVISAMLLHSFRVSYREKIQEQLEAAAYVVAKQISEEDMNNIRTTADYDGEAYRAVSDLMESSFPPEQEFYSQIYCNIQKLDKEKGIAYAVAYLDKSIGVYFPLDEYETEEVRRVYEEREPVWNQESTDVSGTYLALKVPIIGSFNEVVGAVAVGVDTYVIDETLNNMQRRVALSVIVIVMIIWVLATEAMSYILGKEARTRTAGADGERPFPAHLIRLLVFLVFSAYNLSSTFLPVYVLRNSELFSGEMRNLAASLPLTVNIFALGVMSLFCAPMIRRLGMKRLMALSALFAFAGNLLLVSLPNYYAIFLGLLLDGIGEGLIMNTLYVILTYIKNEEDRQSGFTIYNAAYLSGVNFGMLSGSLLAVAFGQRPVFLVTTLTWAGLLVFGLYLVRQLEGFVDTAPEAAPGGTETETGTKVVAGGTGAEAAVGAGTGAETRAAAASSEGTAAGAAGISSFRFITDKAVMSFIVLIQNPYIIFNSFVFYLVPIFCSENGYNETIVSILIMLYSQIAVLSGDRLTERMSALFGSKAIYTALLLNVTAVLVFALTGSMTGLVAALLILGFSAAFGKPVQQNYFLNRKAAVLYGEDRAIGVYNFTENIGESLGPIVFSRLMGASLHGYTIFLTVIAGCCGLHFAANMEEVKRERV